MCWFDRDYPQCPTRLESLSQAVAPYSHILPDSLRMSLPSTLPMQEEHKAKQPSRVQARVRDIGPSSQTRLHDDGVGGGGGGGGAVLRPARQRQTGVHPRRAASQLQGPHSDLILSHLIWPVAAKACGAGLSDSAAVPGAQQAGGQ